ncbi:hypothetical protein C1H76_4589 [Elsinoe australis]|uniref:Uncharacterized protein n=1 Tax=Elsinoe australis TaxID=40998 RepID=A0A4U7AYT5_9PEZI|nr:hypothetical protein C1H76_4589 [Elsinoe australis]
MALIGLDASDIKDPMTRSDRERKALGNAHPQIRTMAYDLQKPLGRHPSISHSGTFERQGLDWMINQEKTQYKGGLGGDEMSIDKTI